MINIPKADIPIVILFGPPMCGKTMTLVRLCHYLLVKGYLIQPCTEFHRDPYYEERCKSFIKSIDASEAQPANGLFDDMFVEIFDEGGNSVCYIYDASGDFYTEPKNIPRWILSLFLSSNPKIWCFYTEPNYADMSVRYKYEQTIEYVYFKFSIPSRDKFIIIHNKIDTTPFMISYQKVDVASTLQSVKDLYPYLFDVFRNTSIIQRWFEPYKFKFVPFTTGMYVIRQDEYGYGSCSYVEGPDIFPANLWNNIQ